MKGRYYYFCSEGSIFTVSTVSGREGTRMGKYMKKAKRVQSMEVSQSSLLGVRTRARVKQTIDSIGKHIFPCSPSSNKPSKSSQSTPISSKSEFQYMQLRSRRLEKLPRRNGKYKKSAELSCNGTEVQLADDRRDDQDPASELPRGSKITDLEVCLVDERLVNMPARNSCSSRPAFVSVRVPSAVSFVVEDANYSRVSSPAQSSIPAPSQAFAPPKSSQMGAGIGDAPSRMVTRHLKHEADSMLMDIRWESAADTPSLSGNISRELGVGPCSGDSRMIAGPPMRERTDGRSTRSQQQDCPKDDLTHSIEAPQLLCRSGMSSQARFSSAPPLSGLDEALVSTEIEAFFASAEQMERRHFIERYNFDPLTERPLKGRYQWLKE